MSSKTSRISFVKIWLLQITCLLKDVFVHGGNVGIINTQNKEKQYSKFGIVDYDCEIAHEVFGIYRLSTFNKKDLLQRTPSLPVFKEICQRITDEDIFEACHSLASPKMRTYSGARGDLLLVQFPRSHTTSDHVIDKVYDEVVKELQRSQLAENDKNKVIKELEQLKHMIKDNLKVVTSQLIEELGPKLKDGKELKDRKDRKEQPLEGAKHDGLTSARTAQDALTSEENDGILSRMTSTFVSGVKRFF